MRSALATIDGGAPAPVADLPELEPWERLEVLCDPGSLDVIRSGVVSSQRGVRASAGDGVVTASATIAGRPVFCYAEDGRVLGGSVGRMHADSMVRVMRLAGEARVPVVGFVESAGARMQEGMSALAGYGRVFKANVELSGRVPQISIVTSTSAGGGCYSPALTDFVVMTERASMFLTGPKVVEEVTGEVVSAEALGGSRVQSANGVCHCVAASDIDAAIFVRELLSHLPQNAWEAPPRAPSQAPLTADPGAYVPSDQRRVYDVRDVVRGIVDGAAFYGGAFLEIAPRWARNVVTGFARIDGRPVGIVANQPRHLGGVIDVAAAQKASRFVRTCNAFGVPLVVLVDTPGFMPGTKQESAAIIRHGAKLLFAFAEATVPRVTVILRRAFGGAYISMNSAELGADFVFAWPDASIGIMGATHAVGIVHRREIAAAANPAEERVRLADSYAREHQRAFSAAREGHVDEVIAPADTRPRLRAALGALEYKIGRRGDAGNIPL